MCVANGYPNLCLTRVFRRVAVPGRSTDVGQLRHCFGTVLGLFAVHFKLHRSPRDEWHTLFRAHADFMLVGCCHPMS